MDKNCINEYRAELVNYRRDFHMHPEIGFDVIRTARRIVEILSQWDVEIEKDFCKTAVIATVKGTKPGKVIGLRADMDALAIVDEKEVEYHSKNAGYCHACGHDVHVTWALGVLKYFSSHKDELEGTLKVVFQPAEEGPAPGGAKPIAESGRVDDVDIMLGCHTHPDFPVGKVYLRRNELFASADNFNIVIRGTGGHGAYPHQCKDAMMTAIETYTAFQNIVSRELNPTKSAVLSICFFNSGTPKAPNVIQPVVTFGGSVRSFDNDVRDYIFNRMETILKNLCEMNGCTYELKVEPISIALRNDDELIDLFEDACQEVVGEENVIYMQDPEMAYDDFSYFSKKIRSSYFYIGTTKEEDLGKFTFHQPLFDVDEDCLCLGVQLLVNVINKVGESMNR